VIPVQPLPYAPDALEPYLSAQTLRVHHDVLYRRYVERTNRATSDALRTTHDAVRYAVTRGDKLLFDQAAQAWNHEVYFESMCRAGGEPSARMRAVLGRDFADRWRAAAASVFGSGWVWLVRGKWATPAAPAVEIVTTTNAHLPNMDAVLLTMDVWEHAYFCDYPGVKNDYAEAWVTRLANWDRAQRLLGLG
jgi:Fe-Mn family superoxide dismutase